MAILSRLAAVALCILLTASAAQARVKVPDYSHLNRKTESGKPGSPPSLPVKVDSVSRASLSHDRAKDSPYRELLSLLDDLPDMPDVVSVAERVG